MKEIIRFTKFIFKVIFYVIVILVMLILLNIFIVNYKYKKYENTGIMKNGNLCISHAWEGGGGYAQKVYISNENIIAETDSFALNDRKDGIFGKVYKPISSGNTDLYFGYADFGDEPLNQFELYHIEVDENMNINYSVEIIDEECFEQNIK